ncbi:hypothetical protein WNY51_11760 [Pseudocolwellia sp. AS88]
MPWLRRMYRRRRANEMQTDSANGGNAIGDQAEVSRRHSSQMPIVMVGTR